MLVACNRGIASAFLAGHPAWRRCSSVEYCLYAPSSRLSSRAPRCGIH